MSTETGSEAPPENTIEQRLDELFAAWNRIDGPGMTVGIAKAGKTLYRRAFGMASLETSVANTPKTRMRIGSTTKHFTCLLALLLAEEGKLDIDAPIRTYIPELVHAGGEPTLRLLMQHRGGSRCYLDLGPIANGFQSVIRRGGALKLQERQRGRNFPLGEAMIYNNGGYHLLSIAIERVGGAPFADQLRARFFEPLGMADTELVSSDFAITPGIATLHVPLPDGRWRRGLFNAEESLGEGAIVSTIDDMLRWMAHLRSRDRFGKPQTWEALLTPPVYPDGSRGMYALGLFLDTYRGLQTIHHGGSVVGGNSQMLMVPDHGLDVVIMANGARAANPSKLTEQVMDILLAEYLSKAPTKTLAKDYQTFLGDWWSAETGVVYSLFDHEGELQCGLCNIPGGFGLKRAGKKRVIMPAYANGEIDFTLDPDVPDSISIKFGCSSARYMRVSKDYGHLEEFATAAAGEYYSHDGDALAKISFDGARVMVRMSGEYGHVESYATPVAETVAVAEPKVMEMGGWAALSFDKQDGLMLGFRLNNWRTRNLEFVRVRTGEASLVPSSGASSQLAAQPS